MAETIKEEIEAVSKGSEHFTENEAGGIGLAVLPVDAAHKEAIKEHIAELAVDGPKGDKAEKVLDKFECFREKG